MYHRHHLHRGRSRFQTSTVPFSTNVDNIYTLQERYKEIVEDEMSLVASPSSLYADRCSSATLHATKNTPPFRSIRLCSSMSPRPFSNGANDESENDDTVVDPYTLESTLGDIIKDSSIVAANDDLTTNFHDDLDDIHGCNGDHTKKTTPMISCPVSPTKITAKPNTKGLANVSDGKKKRRYYSHDDEDDDVSIDVDKLDCSFKSIVTLSSSWRTMDDDYVDTNTNTDENSSQPGEKEQHQQRPPQRNRSPRRGHRRSRNMAMTGQEFWDQVLKAV